MVQIVFLIFPVDDDFFIGVGADVESNEFVGEDKIQAVQACLVQV